MGQYINRTGNGVMTLDKTKVMHLIEDGATIIEEPSEFVENLVCVVDNIAFEAAGYAYCKNEMDAFKHPDGRCKVWLDYPNAKKYAE